MEKIKFVMTDTGAQVSASCRQALEAKGVAVTVCEKNGNKALETLLNVHPQAVLLDAFMPDLDAITVKYEAGTLTFTPKCSLELLKEQKKYMGNYIRCLKIRAEIEGIALK